MYDVFLVDVIRFYQCVARNTASRTFAQDLHSVFILWVGPVACPCCPNETDLCPFIHKNSHTCKHFWQFLLYNIEHPTAVGRLKAILHTRPHNVLLLSHALPYPYIQLLHFYARK
jgi:hypothetical protein